MWAYCLDSDEMKEEKPQILFSCNGRLIFL